MPRPPKKQFHFQIHRSNLDRYWSVIKSSNHKTVWVSETYTSKQNAVIPIKKLIYLLGKNRCTLTFINRGDKC